MFMGTNLRKTVRRKSLSFGVILAMACHILAGVAVYADQLHLKDGRRVNADEVWEVGADIWYRQGKVMHSVRKDEVTRVLRGTPEQVAAQLEAEAAAIEAAKLKARRPNYEAIPATITAIKKDATRKAEAQRAENLANKKAEAAEEAKANPAANPQQKISRIVLKGGVKIDADAVWEEPTRIGYSLGKIQTFIEREAVEQVIHEVVEEDPLPELQLPNLKFTTGHRGLDQLIVHNAIKYDVNPLLIYLVMKQESGFNYRAVSRAGARGLMQLMPETAWRLGVRNIHDPVENVGAGTRYLKSLIKMFNGDVNLALAGYNAGENAVIRYGYRVPPYRETQDYVYSINVAYRRAVAQGQAPSPAQLQAEMQRKQKQKANRERATTANR